MGTKINKFLNSTKQNSQKCFTKFSILQNKILKSCSNCHQLPYFINKGNVQFKLFSRGKAQDS